MLVLAIAAVLRFWHLGRPDSLVFDELYYVRDAISQLAHGYPTVWPDDEPDLHGARALGFSDAPANAVHPPLGKWLIGIGILLFGPDNGWGWRFSVALIGVATVAITMRLGFLLTRSALVANLAGLLLAVDGVHVTLSRVALLDGLLAFFVVLGALFVWRDLSSAQCAETGLHWRRPWLLAAGLAFGAAAAVKWSGLYPLAFFLMFVTTWDVIRRWRAREAHAISRGALQAALTAAIALPAAALSYLATWTGWILTPGGHGRGSGDSWWSALIDYHMEMFGWHSTLTAEHPYMANPLTWPLALKPTAMYFEEYTRGCPWASCVSGISSIPNPLVTWTGVAALLALTALAVSRRRDPLTLSSAFVITGYLSGWLPWVLTFSRSSVFQFYAVVLTPFSALALAMVLALLCGAALRSPIGIAAPLPLTTASLDGRRAAVTVFVAVAVLLGLAFWPAWSGTTVPEWFWQAHRWLPGWN